MFHQIIWPRNILEKAVLRNPAKGVSEPSLALVGEDTESTKLKQKTKQKQKQTSLKGKIEMR